MLAALHLWEETGEDRLRDLVRENADYLLSQWRRDPEYGCHLWIQYRGGRLVRSIGAGHGFASNVHSLLRSGELLDARRREELHRRAAQTAATLAVWETGCPTGRRAPIRTGPPSSRSACSGATARRDSSRAWRAWLARRRRTSCSRRPVSSCGALDRSRRDPGSATELRATAAPSWRWPTARATTRGSTGHGSSRCTRSGSWSALAPSSVGAATPSGRATLVSPSTSGSASPGGGDARAGRALSSSRERGIGLPQGE